jgi:hypothetical protein
MSIITLGTINPYKVSVFKIGATVTANVQISFSYKSGKLPPGLSLSPDGEITGTVEDKVFGLDEYGTTFDQGTTTIEQNYDFTVTAVGSAGQLSLDQQFRIKVKQRTASEIGNMYGYCFLTSSARDALKDFITSSKFFPTGSTYRDQDPNFQTFDYKVLFLAGVHLKSLKTIISYMLNNNYTVALRTGDYKVAKAKDAVGNVLYEVIYVDLIDPKSGADNKITFASQNLPDITMQFNTSTLHISADDDLPIPGTTEDELYINSITNMQNELKAGLTIENFEYLPLWMKSAQDDGLVLGYRLALPLKFAQPGEADKILYRVKNESTYNIRGLPVEFDRWIIDNNLGTTFDDTVRSVSHTGDGSTMLFEGPSTSDIGSATNLKVEIGGVRQDNSVFVVNPKASTTQFTADDSTTDHTVDLFATGDNVVFDSAPADGAAITITVKPTTFNGGSQTIFDNDDSTGTTFDANGTRFISKGVTFDRHAPVSTQLLMQRRSVTDRITHVSNQRDLTRKR